MKCRKCSAELVNGAKFCMICGQKVGLMCPKCKIELPDIAQYCFNCGTEVRRPVVKQPMVKQPVNNKTILDANEMRRLAEIKKQEEQSSVKGAPVWDKTPSGVCDCAVGECDCDGSIWN